MAEQLPSEIMQTTTSRNRVKRLLKLLKDQQDHRAVLTPATVMSFKYLLPFNQRLCDRVDVINNNCSGFDTINLPIIDWRDNYHPFITSQLEAWKITDPDDSEDILIPPALHILTRCYTQDFEFQEAHPTIITWFCPSRHRTLYFFAYTSIRMPSKKYTIPELLELRSKGDESLKAIRPLQKARDDPDLNKLFAQELMDFVNKGITCGRRSDPPGERMTFKPVSQDQDDASTSSEEVLFKGTARRRQAVSRESVASRQIEPKGELAWKYSGRTDPSATEPLSAPTGLPAQKSEGFQRFYKAVVSPTHVRVTAGGRIVPNTRGLPTSPTFKLGHEGSVSGSNGGNGRSTGHATPDNMPTGVGMAQQMPPVMPQYYAGFGHPGFQPYPHHMPYYPMPYGHPMAGGYQPFPWPMPMLRQPSVDALKDTLNLKTGDGQVDNGEESHKGNKVPTAPASQFDQRRPFFYNGQWMYPAPPYPAQAGAMGGQYMPMPMHMPMPGGPAPPMGPRMLAPTQGSLASTQPSQLGSPVKFTGQAALTAHARGLPGAGFMAPTAPAMNGFQAPPPPPISSIRPSEITRKQIGIFRKSLKYHEDQLQYNRHQIDEKETEQKIQKYRDNITRFECMMQAQLEDEKKRGYPPVSEKEKGSEGWSEFDKKSSSVSENTAPNGMPAEQSAVVPAPTTSDNNQMNHNHQIGYSSVRPSSGHQIDDTSHKSVLPTGAALAPPFEPGRDVPMAPAVADGINPMWTIPAYPKQAIDGSFRGYMTGGQPWPASRPGPSVFTSSTGRTFDANVTSVTSKGYLGVPYLIGSLPQGMNPRTAQDIDYQYSRELTEDELRARHLYWGKVPRSAVRGLPKYDGRNFYPPSPIKDGGARDIAAKDSTMDLIAFTPKQIGTQPDIEPGRPSTPVGSALIPCDSFEHGKPVGQDGIVTVTESVMSVTASDKQGSAKGKSETCIDASSVISHDRRSEKPGGARLWEAMLKKGSSAALTSTTAEGKLQQQYAGSAAASLSPTINRTMDGPASLSPGKESVDSSDGGALLTPVPERRGKNRALTGEASHEQLALNGSGSVPTTLGA